MRRAIRTPEASSGNGPYSQGIIAGDFVYVSGQGPLDPQSGGVVGSTIEEQTELTLKNIQNILKAAECTMDDVIKVNVFLASLKDFDRFNSVYVQFFNQPMPARTCVEAGLDDILVEIDAIAHLPDKNT
ncbi:RidA family protein [Lederbergia citrea]|uniref:Rid family detoxifying hydrolase n=1 Tax=Lederbergia citrea TaxID=2833581 RepID=A0A942UWR6_9BACI|nr:Rid family detoxifying hydrolase [Lederbergia citrea]MBS4178732.1 Rid family detoxifying hydrolase [Lederbergia citrea]MBS4205438.1 Rid family detoxifying hydrolase [Lederbergia citrea]MBS4224244.1 Rid family detoxifying hydrolase [Lederbergia citrea]